MEQAHLSLLVLAHRGTMEKMKGQITNTLDLAMVMALRLAVLLHRSRTDVALPPIEAHYRKGTFYLHLDAGWLHASPLTTAALQEEIKEWNKLGVEVAVESLDEIQDVELLGAD